MFPIHHTPHYKQIKMTSLNEFLKTLTTHSFTKEEWDELRTRLENEKTETLKLLYFIAKDKDLKVNELARRERRHMDIQRRWENLLFIIREAYDHAKLRENLGPWILSTEHALEIMYHSCKVTTDVFQE